MGGLNTSLSIATGALEAQEGAITITSNNIANATTPGYARETVELSESGSTEEDGVSIGDGVTLQGYDSVRDQVLNQQIQQQTSQQSSVNAQVSALEQVQTLFPSSGASLATDMSNFFSSISALSAAPASAATRQSVISSGQDLAQEFNSVAASLTGQQSSLNDQVGNDVSQINDITSQIAQLNPQLAQLKVEDQDGGSVEDQISSLESQLSQLTNISVIQTAQGDTITTGNGTPLVTGDQSNALQTSTASNGMVQVEDASGTNITSNISGGDLEGAITARDTDIPSLLNSLNTLASQFATAMNTANEAGYDQNGNQGTVLFTGSSAATIQMATSDPTAIAASSDGSSGSNGNVATLAAVQNSAMASGVSPTAALASLVYQVGNMTSNATTESTALSTSLSQLNQQLSNVSGVSTDEESANLIRYQQAYQAAAEIVNTVSTLFSATLSMMTSGGV